MLTNKQKEDFTKECDKGLKVFYDYNDEANSHFISCISAHHDEVKGSFWMESFKDELYDWCNPNDSIEGFTNDIMNLCESVGIDYTILEDNEIDNLFEIARDHLFYEPDYEHYLKQEICVDIFIDTGDYKGDLGCNQVYPHYNGVRGANIEDEFCLVWLAKTQGYTKQQLENVLNNITQEMSESKFLESCYDELQNCTSHMNSLIFLRKMTLKEYLETLDSKEDIYISKDTRCGLFDEWCGAGGLLDIHLEKDIQIPRTMIHKIIEDGQFRFNVHEVYGVNDSFWEN